MPKVCAAEYKLSAIVITTVITTVITAVSKPILYRRAQTLRSTETVKLLRKKTYFFCALELLHCVHRFGKEQDVD